MSSLIRSLVSKKKRRFQKDGFDLDLSYITENIVAMGWPSEGRETYYRNPMVEVVKMLNQYHEGKFKVYNLCAERDYKPHFFNNSVARYPFYDHQAPSLDMMGEFCEDADKWVSADPENVIVAHCKAGKGRTGVMIVAYLLHKKMFTDAEEAMSYYADKRTKNSKGVTIPSQRRYIKYYNEIVKNGMPRPFFVAIKSLTIKMENMELVVLLYQRDTIDKTKLVPLLSNRQDDAGASFAAEVAYDKGEFVITTKDLMTVSGDIKIEFYEGTINKKTCIFYTWFNTSFLAKAGNSLKLVRDELDKPRKDLKGSVELEVRFEAVDHRSEGARAAMRRTSTESSPSPAARRLAAEEALDETHSSVTEDDLRPGPHAMADSPADRSFASSGGDPSTSARPSALGAPPEGARTDDGPAASTPAAAPPNERPVTSRRRAHRPVEPPPSHQESLPTFGASAMFPEAPADGFPLGNAAPGSLPNTGAPPAHPRSKRKAHHTPRGSSKKVHVHSQHALPPQAHPHFPFSSNNSPGNPPGQQWPGPAPEPPAGPAPAPAPSSAHGWPKIRRNIFRIRLFQGEMMGLGPSTLTLMCALALPWAYHMSSFPGVSVDILDVAFTAMLVVVSGLFLAWSILATQS